VRAAAWGACLAATLALAQDSPGITPFSAASPGAPLPPGWREQHLPRAAPSPIELVRDGDATVLQVRSNHSAGGAAFAIAGGQSATRLAWRWKVDRVVEGAEMGLKSGDDYAARVYVFFAVPVEELPWGDRVRVKLARIIFGEELPTAGICYVWDNRHPEGTTAWSAYTKRVRMVVVESGPARAGQWVAESRDLDADFRAAFGSQWRKPMPRVSGIAIGNDTDQTGERASAWFGDLRLDTPP
jgi:hypothetical protein